jgi:hypothetical protein
MPYLFRTLIVFLLAAGLGFSGCAQAEDEEAALHDPVKIEVLEGTGLSRLVVEAPAAERLGIDTAPVRGTRGGGDGKGNRKVVPFAAVFYAPNGETWAYKSVQPLTFVRHRIHVERIDGRRAILSSGPPEGTPVMTVGASELWGMETGVGH